MEPSECCTFRIIAASVVGSIICAIFLWYRSPVFAILLVPVAGSLMAVGAMLLFQSVRPFVSKEPIGLDVRSDYFIRRLGFR
ncbi:hypothetical protein FV226_26915 [Methylobacterium sp. WL12]|nr:hypothetical protein FV226_26915 [Methylobacterium sp. WL12]TXM66857.1 hypothetical protein FV229_11565 [Methylobacterium sp. WL120]TXN15777.1 hypothetical protein FV219_02015 [Methylobacterium sp. WL122]TXN83008.1 hypothetical protein FV234_08255 [Methylobacterium sp. WL8]